MKIHKRQNVYKGVNFYWLMAITIVISVAMVSASLTVFLRSSAYETVKQIRIAARLLSDKKIDGVDTSSPIQAYDIRMFARSIDARISSVADESDFDPDLLREEKLGF